MVPPAADLVENLILSSVDFHHVYADAINAASTFSLKTPRDAKNLLMMSFVFPHSYMVINLRCVRKQLIRVTLQW